MSDNAVVRTTPPPKRRGPAMLIDTSSSMTTIDPGSTMRRIDHLATIMGQLLSRVRLTNLIAFNSSATEVPLTGAVNIPEPTGGTNLLFALHMVPELTPLPTRLIVICDGEVMNGEACLDFARSRIAPMDIDAYFVGSDLDTRAIRFMEELSRAGGEGGRSGKFNLADHEKLAATIVLAITDQRPRRI